MNPVYMAVDANVSVLEVLDTAEDRFRYIFGVIAMTCARLDNSAWSQIEEVIDAPCDLQGCHCEKIRRLAFDTMTAMRADCLQQFQKRTTRKNHGFGSS